MHCSLFYFLVIFLDLCQGIRNNYFLILHQHSPTFLNLITDWEYCRRRGAVRFRTTLLLLFLLLLHTSLFKPEIKSLQVLVKCPLLLSKWIYICINISFHLSSALTKWGRQEIMTPPQRTSVSFKNKKSVFSVTFFHPAMVKSSLQVAVQLASFRRLPRS